MVVRGLVVALAVAGCSSHAASGVHDSAVPDGDGGAGTSDAGTSGAGTSGAGTSGAGSGGAGAVDALPPSDANPSTAEGFCRGYLDLFAAYFSRCDGVPLDYARRLFASDVPCNRFAADIAAHRIAFDGTHGASCLQAIGTVLAACGGSTSMQDAAACAGVLTPLVPVGGTCTSFYIVGIGEQCQDGAYCKEGASYACTGVCTARNPLGGACDLISDVRCVPGVTCDSTAKVCVAIPAAPGAGDTCGAPNQPSCARTFYCDRTGVDAGAGIGVCHARKTSGACASDTECAAPIRCAGTTTKMCAAPKLEGEACTPGAHECDVVSHCGADGKCTSVGAAIDQPCGTINGESTPCATGDYCDVSLLSNMTGTCHAQKHDGDDCTGGLLLSECSGDNGHCDATTHKCLSCTP
jgi:hypothetical protein